MSLEAIATLQDQLLFASCNNASQACVHVCIAEVQRKVLVLSMYRPVHSASTGVMYSMPMCDLYVLCPNLLPH